MRDVPTPLKELQYGFKALVSGSQSPVPRTKPPFLGAGGRLNWKARLEIYRYAYVTRLEESLVQDFPRLRKKVGERKFHKLVVDYLALYPSRYTSVAEVSQNFPEFLKSAADSFLAELARFEWQLVLVSLIETSKESNLSNLAQAMQTSPGDYRLVLHPSVCLFESGFAVHLGQKTQKRSRYVLWNNGRGSVFQSLSSIQWDILRGLEAGCTIEDLSRWITAENILQEKFSQWMAYWTEHGVIHSFEKGELCSIQK